MSTPELLGTPFASPSRRKKSLPWSVHLGAGLNRCGLVPRTPFFHLWLHGESIGEFERAAGLMGELARRNPRYRLLLTSRAAATRRWLRDRFPGETVLPPPANIEWAVRSFLVRLKVHGLLLLEQPHDLGAVIFAVGRWLRISVIVIRAARVDQMGAGLADVDHFIAGDADTAAALCRAGVPPSRMTVVSDAEALIIAIGKMLRERLSASTRGSAVGMSRPSRWVLTTRLGRAALALRTERIGDLAMLRSALGQGDSLLCLGNGPSCEDSRVKDIDFDALFRVNWSWRARGFLTHPDVVFTRRPMYPAGVGTPILGIRTIEQEQRVLRRRLLALRPWRARYFTIERLAVSINERRWPARPTGGAAMIATAAALQPRRLIIAGMDLYEHPAGAYPGDADTANSYPLMHERDTEVAVIDWALRGFDGELVILSEPLRRALHDLRGEEKRR